MMILLSLLTFFMPLQIQNIEASSLKVHFEGSPEYGSGWVLTITLQAEEDLKKAEIWVENSEGFSIKSGSPFWHGALKSGDEAVIELSYTLVGPLPQDITVNLVGRTSSGKRFTKQVHRNIEYTSTRT